MGGIRRVRVSVNEAELGNPTGTHWPDCCSAQVGDVAGRHDSMMFFSPR
jgi:hypothetical protein